MTTEKLFELLKRVETVTSNRWNDVLKIVKIMPSIEVKEKNGMININKIILIIIH